MKFVKILIRGYKISWSRKWLDNLIFRSKMRFRI